MVSTIIATFIGSIIGTTIAELYIVPWMEKHYG